MFVGFADESKITNISPDQVKDIGENVILNCTVENPLKYNVLWSKNGEMISMTQTLVAPSDQIKIEHEIATNTFSLHVS